MAKDLWYRGYVPVCTSIYHSIPCHTLPFYLQNPEFADGMASSNEKVRKLFGRSEMYDERWDILLDNVCCRGCLEISRGPDPTCERRTNVPQRIVDSEFGVPTAGKWIVN